MKLFIRELPNNSVNVVTESGQIIWTFSGIADACHACREWNRLPHSEPVEYFIEAVDELDWILRVA